MLLWASGGYLLKNRYKNTDKIPCILWDIVPRVSPGHCQKKGRLVGNGNAVGEGMRNSGKDVEIGREGGNGAISEKLP